VINAGVYGYTSFQGVRRLRECLTYEPDLVLVSFGANDAHLVGGTDAAYARRLTQRRAMLRLLNLSRLGQLVLAALDKVDARMRHTEPTRRVEIEEYRANLGEMVRLCRERGARPVLLTRPFQGHTHDPESWKSMGPDYNQVTREVGAKLDVPVIDVFKEFKKRRHLFEDESHFTVAGHWEAARFIYQELLPVLGEPQGHLSSGTKAPDPASVTAP
jgi:lysophospholipase L1-like esterase